MSQCRCGVRRRRAPLQIVEKERSECAVCSARHSVRSKELVPDEVQCNGDAAAPPLRTAGCRGRHRPQAARTRRAPAHSRTLRRAPTAAPMEATHSRPRLYASATHARDAGAQPHARAKRPGHITSHFAWRELWLERCAAAVVGERTRGGRMQCTKEWNGTAQHIECLVSVVH